MKVAIVGCGQIADAHIEQCRKIPDVEISAVCDANQHMAEQAAVRYAVAGIHTDLATLMDDIAPDVVHITTPPHSHLPLAKIALEGGAHVYIEKPFVVNAAEAEQLVAAAVANHRLACVGHNYTFDSAFTRLKDLCEKGVLGEVVHIDALMGYDLGGQFGAVMMKDPNHWVHELPGGLVQNNISHPLSMVMDLLEDAMPAVHARGKRLRKERFGDVRDRLFDEMRVLLTGRRSTANITFTCAARPAQLSIGVYGTISAALAHLDARTLRMTFGAEMPGPFRKLQWAFRDLKEARREHRRHIGNMLRSRLHFFEGMHALIEAFYRAITNEGPMPIDMSQAVRTTTVMDEIFKQSTLNESDSEPGGDFE